MKASFPLGARRGSVLLVALIFSLIFAISLTTYLQLATNALKMSQRSFLGNDAMNINEAGLEQMLWSFNYANDQRNAGVTETAWSSTNGWSTSGSNAWKTVSNFPLSQNATGTAKIFIQNYNSTGSPAPVAVCKSVLLPANGPSIVKMVQVTLARRSYFSTGLVAKNGVTFSGNNASVDSWNSNPLNLTPSPNYAYNSTYGPRAAHGGVATTSVSSTVDVNNADIYGYVSVGSASDSAIYLGSQGVIGDFSSASGTKDADRITTNFTADLPDIIVPTQSYIAYKEPGNNNYITGAGKSELPVTSDINGNKGVTTTSSVTTTVGGVTTTTTTSKVTYYYTVEYIRIAGKATSELVIKDGYNVVIKVTDTGSAVTTAGSAGITIGAGSTLAIYTSGSVSITGSSEANGADGGVANTGAASAFQIWGTGASGSGQAISVQGNGSLRGIVYAPNAAIKIVGNGEVSGSVVGNTIQVTGNAAFHYDESLVNYGGSNAFKVSKWSEIRSNADRATWTTTVNATAGSSFF